MFTRKKPQAVYCNHRFDDRPPVWKMAIEGLSFLLALLSVFTLLLLCSAIVPGA